MNIGRIARWMPVLAVASLALLMGATAGQAQGDFGRDRPSLLAKRLGHHPRTHTPGFSSSHDWRVPLTAAETEYRVHADALSRGYAHTATHGRFSEYEPLIPRRIRGWFKSEVSASAYAAGLRREAYRSSDARLNAIIDDIRADRRHIDAFWIAANDVYDADNLRLAELNSGFIDPRIADDILRRIDENRAIMDIVLFALEERLVGYRVALNEAFVAAPSPVFRGAWLEFEQLDRHAQRLKANGDGLGRAYVRPLPPADGCVIRSLARAC